MRISDWSSDVCSSDLSVVPLGDLQGTLRYFRTTPFVQSPRLGRFDLRDLRIANGTLKVIAGEGESEPTMLEIEACCMEDRKSVVEGKRVSGRVDLGGGRTINKKTRTKQHTPTN